MEAPQRARRLRCAARLPPHRTAPREDPNEYIRWRFQHGDDKEALAKDTMVLTDEEKEKVKEPAPLRLRTRRATRPRSSGASRSSPAAGSR